MGFSIFLGICAAISLLAITLVLRIYLDAKDYMGFKWDLEQAGLPVLLGLILLGITPLTYGFTTCGFWASMLPFMIGGLASIAAQYSYWNRLMASPDGERIRMRSKADRMYERSNMLEEGIQDIKSRYGDGELEGEPSYVADSARERDRLRQDAKLLRIAAANTYTEDGDELLMEAIVPLLMKNKDLLEKNGIHVQYGAHLPYEDSEERASGSSMAVRAIMDLPDEHSESASEAEDGEEDEEWERREGEALWDAMDRGLKGRPLDDSEIGAMMGTIAKQYEDKQDKCILMDDLVKECHP